MSVGGDFNAKLCSASEFVSECPEVVGRFPQLAAPRVLPNLAPQSNNLSARLLIDLAITARLICTTGRGHGDAGQPTCRNATRTEHVLLDPDLFGAPFEVSFGKLNTESDHVPMRLRFRRCGGMAGHAGNREGMHGAGHECTEACHKRAREECVLRWREDPQFRAAYSACLEADVAGRAAVEQAIEAGDGDQASTLLKGMVLAAAQRAQMARPWRCPFQRRDGARRPAWFDTACRESKAALRAALNSGTTSHAYQQLKREHRRLARRTRRNHDRHRLAHLLDRLQSRDPSVYKELKTRTAKVNTLVTTDDWHAYIQKQFAPTPSPAPPPPPPPPPPPAATPPRPPTPTHRLGAL